MGNTQRQPQPRQVRLRPVQVRPVPQRARQPAAVRQRVRQPAQRQHSNMVAFLCYTIT